MGGNPITQEVAVKALKKLRAVDVSEKGDAHPTFAIYYRKRLVAITGIRHSSNRDILLPHIKADLRVNAPFVLGLARCTKYRNHYLYEVGLISEEDSESDKWVDDYEPA